MKQKTTVITGGAGFLGSHLVDRFLDEGHRVIAIDNLITGNLANLEHVRSHPGFDFIQQDVTEFLDIAGDVDNVLHFASPASPVDYLELPIQTLKVGSLGTHKTLGLARSKRARYLLASTSEVYGDPQVHPQREDYWGHVNCVGPRGVYDEAKRFAEAMTMAYRRSHAIDAKIVRIFNTYGPRMRLQDGRALPNFLHQALLGNELTVYGDGSQTRSFCYVSDLVDGIARMLVSKESGPINLGNPGEVTILEVAREVQALTGSASKIVHRELPCDDPKVRRPDITLARERLGWTPKVPRAEGLRTTIADFRSRIALPSA